MKMPRQFQLTWPVRFYECDRYGHVNHVNYLRFMQEAAIRASADAGFGMEEYDRIGQYWLIRGSEIEYFAPLHFGDTVTIRTWVSDFRRMRSKREYLFSNQDGEQIARASTDWIFLDRESNRPAAIPKALIAAFFPEGAPAQAPRRKPFPPAPAAPEPFSRPRRVSWQDIDAAGHVNNAVYLGYLQDIGLEICSAYGWPMNRMHAAGFSLIARRVRIEYLIPALIDDELEIKTWITDVRRSTALRHYIIRRAADDEILARAHILWVWVDPHSGRPVRIPADFLADFRPNTGGIPSP